MPNKRKSDGGVLKETSRKTAKTTNGTIPSEANGHSPNGNASQTSPARTAHDENGKEGSESSNTISSETPVALQPFTIIYADTTEAKKLEGDPIEEENPFSDKLTRAYIIRPQSKWSGMTKYRKFVIGDQVFELNDFVLVAHGNSEAPSKATNGSKAARKTGDERNFWVAKVLEIRAVDAQNVFLRVLWMYWAAELHCGPKPYHGQFELVASNHLDIIDAMTVEGKVKVEHWQELDSEEVLDGLYWRQTYNLKSQQLSALRKHCVCERPYNPDLNLLNCADKDCDMWLHEECVVDAALSEMWAKLQAKAEGIVTNGVVRGDKRRKSASTVRPWKRVFSGKIQVAKKPTKLVITDHRDEVERDKHPASDDPSCPATIELDVHCLKCGTHIK